MGEVAVRLVFSWGQFLRVIYHI